VSHVEHTAQAPASVVCSVLTVSDSRTADTDTSGRAIREMLGSAGHPVAGHAIVKDEPAQVISYVRAQLADPHTQVIITTGGTGLTSRDGTFEAIDSLLEKRLEGFGELFRMLSFQEIGAAAMMSRATAGTASVGIASANTVSAGTASADAASAGTTSASTASRKAIFVLPGSEHAVRLAMTRLILPELGHIVQQLRK
jgi:molybdenum cofactor biosynthesis protein B